MSLLSPLASISCYITSIHVFFYLPSVLLTFPKLIHSTCQTGASVGLRRTWPNHRRQFSLIFSPIQATPILVRISSFLTLSLYVLLHIQRSITSLLHSSSGHVTNRKENKLEQGHSTWVLKEGARGSFDATGSNLREPGSWKRLRRESTWETGATHGDKLLPQVPTAGVDLRVARPQGSQRSHDPSSRWGLWLTSPQKREVGHCQPYSKYLRHQHWWPNTSTNPFLPHKLLVFISIWYMR